AFAAAGAAMNEPRWIEIAREALDAARSMLFASGSLLRIAKDGKASAIPGFLEDWADLANAALDVHDATLDPAPLAFAGELARGATERFWDEDEGAFYFAPERDDLLVRPKDTYDNAVPSGTSSIVRALLRLSAYGHDDELFARAERTLRGVSVAAMESPMGFGYLVCALDLYANGPTELDVVAEADDAGAAVLIAEARRTYVPDLI